MKNQVLHKDFRSDCKKKKMTYYRFNKAKKRDFETTVAENISNIVRELVSSMSKAEKIALLQSLDRESLDFLVAKVLSKILKGKLR